jgi:outer membrane lipoprotein-sorting protein
MLFASSSRLAALVAVSLVASAFGAEPAIIAKARAYLGPEAALNGVKSVHYVGTKEVPNAGDPTKPTLVSIDLIFQAPANQRTVQASDTVIETTALCDFYSWHRTQDAKNPTRWSLKFLPQNQVSRQAAIVWENLAFFRGLERAGGQTLDQGRVALNGVACRKVSFVHDANVVFIRYFDEATGRLLLTETEDGGTTREQGELMVSGIRFPKRILNTVKGPGGKEQVLTITFDQITVNEDFPRSTFVAPTLNH